MDKGDHCLAILSIYVNQFRSSVGVILVVVFVMHRPEGRGGVLACTHPNTPLPIVVLTLLLFCCPLSPFGGFAPSPSLGAPVVGFASFPGVPLGWPSVAPLGAPLAPPLGFPPVPPGVWVSTGIITIITIAM